MPRRLAILTALGLLAAGLGLGALRVGDLEASELELESAARPLSEWRQGHDATSVSARMLTAELGRGERVVFELCSPEDLDPAVVQDAFSVAVLHLGRGEKMLLVPLDAPHMELVKRSSRGACLPLGGGIIEQPGLHSLELVWLDEGEPAAAAAAVPLAGRVLARTPLRSSDRLYVLALGLAALLGIGLLWWPGRERGPGDREAAGDPEAALPAGVPGADAHPGVDAASTPPREARPREWLEALAAFLLLAATTQLPLFGATLALLKGALLVAVQVGAALLLVRAADTRGRLRALCLTRPAPRAQHGLAPELLWIPASLAGAALLAAAAALALRLVPATGEAPIQTFISWPSGMLSFAALGVLLPVAEEIFFRGYLYRAALSLGRAWAFTITVVLFVVLHAQQSWGNWGGLLAIAITGLALTTLRVWSGSVLVPALAHLLYNFALSVASF